jgi:hypothetical protein
MYSKVKTWQDLCDTNIDFLQGKQDETFYHLGPTNEETDSILNELIQLNSNGFFTTNSQPYINKPDNKQISYLEFNLPYEITHKLLPELLLDNQIYFSFHSCSSSKHTWIDTFPSSRYNLTKYKKDDKWYECTNWNKNSMIDEENKILEPEICILAQTYSSKNIYNLLVDSVCIFITGKEYDMEFCAINKLIKLAKKIDLFI